MIELTETNSAQIANALMRARTAAGSPAMGMVMTLIIVATEDDSAEAMRVAREATHEHPARVLGVVLGDARGHGVVSAQVGSGSGWTGETAIIRLKGAVVAHADSVVLPLLLPDSPVAIWWAGDAPDSPADDPLGRLARRRITDAAAAQTAKTKALPVQCLSYVPGNTDLAWTRLTPWRALLAASLDQQPLKVRSASVVAERISPSADLLVAWLADRLRVDVRRETSSGPGITEVSLETAEGPIRISREDGRMATFTSPDQPDRPVALRRRGLPELLTEELRRFDEDDVYAAAVTALRARRGGGSRSKTRKARA